MSANASVDTPLSVEHKAIIPISAFAACGDLNHLSVAIEDGLNAGLSVNSIKELLVQVYAYAGFPRSLNSLGAFMKVLDRRREQGIEDTLGPTPSQVVPAGAALLEAGTRNQTQLVGAPVSGPLFDFAPAIDAFLKTHLFGDIFSRDNLDWQAREIATISMLSALDGLDAQLQSHLGVSMNVGITENALREFVVVLSERVDHPAAERANEALTRLVESKRNAA